MKKIISTIIVICLLFSSVSTMVYAEGNTSLSAGYINTINAKTNESVAYQGICKNDTIYMSPNDIAAIGGYDCETLSLERETAESIIESSTILSKLYSRLNIDKLFKKEEFEYLVFSRKDTTTDYITQIYYYDGYAQTMSKSFEIDTIKYDGQTYLNLEKMLYLMHAQWCVEESFLYYYPLDYNIFDFIGEEFSYMYENSVQHNSLLYDGENKWGHSTRIVLSHILNDVDMRIFIPFFGSDMIQQDWYEEAILQLATTDDSFIDDYGSEQISNYLKDSPYHKIKTELNAIDGTLGAIEDLPNKMADTKLNKFSRWNDLSTINTEQFDTLQKKLTSFSNIVSTANILVDFNEINTRSKEWSNDFVNGLNILYTINKDIYGDYGKDILKVADNLLDEYENPTEEATEAAILDTCELILDNLIEKPIVGRIESIIALSNVIIKSNPNCAEAIENADLMNTVHALINVENVFLNEFVDSYHDYLHYLGVEDGSSSLRLFELMYTSINENPQKEVETHAISDMRNALEMFLKTSLRNKTYVYHFSYFNKGGSLWTLTSEAKALENDIYKTYALLSELISTRDYDILLYLDESYNSMYSNEYGLLRQKIDVNILSDCANENIGKSEPVQIESFLSKKPFIDNKDEFAISFEYRFDTVEAWNGGTLTNFPQAMNDTFCITGDFDHDGIEDSICSEIAADDDCTRFNFNVKTKDRIYVTDVCPSYAICNVYAYVIKGENEDYLVRESSAKRIVESDDDESTEDYYWYETIFVFSIKSKTSISYEFFCNKQTDGYKFTTSGWDGSGHIGDLIYQSWENSDSKNQICDSESSAIEYIKAALEKSGLSERVMGSGVTNCRIIPICAVNKTMNSENQGTAVLCTNESSTPQTTVDNNDMSGGGYAGNQTAEQLRKSIIGNWGLMGDYTFDTNGICYFYGDKNRPGTYKITENKKLIIDFPWTHNEYTWSELSFDEFHEEHNFDEYFWCITAEGVLRLNGSDYYRDGRIPLD